MRKQIWLACLAVLLMAAPGYAEEFVLKDGTKIVGRMMGLKGDSIEVQTSYGKMQIRRSDLVSINFPENQPKVGSDKEGPKPVPAVVEKLEGTSYTNSTGRFTLTVPLEWKVSKEMRQTVGKDVLAALTSRDETRFLLVVAENFSGSLEAYKGLVLIQMKQALNEYEKLGESQLSVDGNPAILLTVRGLSPAANNLPIEYLVAIVPYEGKMVRLVAFCAEPLFNESQRIFENIVSSFQRIREEPSSAPTKSPPFAASQLV